MAQLTRPPLRAPLGKLLSGEVEEFIYIKLLLK